MDLTEGQREELLQRLNEVWKPPRRCPVCGENTWEINPKVFEVREFFEGGIVVGGHVAPCVIVICKNCSNTLFFNAIQLRLVKKPEKGSESGRKEK